MNKVLEVLGLLFFMIGFLTIAGLVINYCVDFWFDKIKKK